MSKFQKSEPPILTAKIPTLTDSHPVFPCVVTVPPLEAAVARLICGSSSDTLEGASKVVETILNVVGGIPTPLKNMKVNWDDYSKYMRK